MLAEALLDLLGGALAFRLLGGSWDTWGAATRKGLSLALEQLTAGPLWWSMLAALAVWPLIAGVWPRLWGWAGSAAGTFSPTVYAMSALLPVTALLLGLIPPPGEPTGSSQAAHRTPNGSASAQRSDHSGAT